MHYMNMNAAAIVSADAFAFVSRARSLSSNQLCGLNYKGEGTYTTEGIVAIVEMLKVNTTLQSIRCVARVRFLSQASAALVSARLLLIPLIPSIDSHVQARQQRAQVRGGEACRRHARRQPDADERRVRHATLYHTLYPT